MIAERSSIVEKIVFPEPDLNTDANALALTVIKCMFIDTPPPIIIANIHFKTGFRSLINRNVMKMPAANDNGVVIKSSMLSIQGL